jgi:spore coat protein U-like protein
MRLSLLAIAAGTLAAGSAFAGPSPQSSDFQVTASVTNSCIITSTTGISFAAYDPADTHFAAPLDASGTVNVRCTRGTNAAVALDQGDQAATTSSCSAPLRQMTDGGSERLRYDIYQNAARNIPWGCDAANDQAFTAAASNVPTTLTTYGRIPPGQDVAAGNFTDTVVVSVTF